jgi:hypothetical protein
MPAVLFKPIKPAKFNSAAIQAEIERAAKLVADGIRLDFELTVSKWSRRPKFETLLQVGPASVEILVGTDNEIYRYVSEGTRPHVIVPKKAKALRFREGYNAKTIPGVIPSQAGGAFGGVVYSQGVFHPGTKAREFEKLIEKEWRPRFKKEMEQAMKAGARASGHGVR